MAEATKVQHVENQNDECSAFPNDEARDLYVKSVAPRRELVCPITQECFHDPVVAEDGHTYERKSILTWFHCGKMRSPVTNELMKGRSLVPNRNLSAMALAHREQLGYRLLSMCRSVWQNKGRCDDGGDRMEALLDAGADTNIRDSKNAGATCLHHLIRSDRADLARMILLHNVSVLAVDERGESVSVAAERMSKRSANNKSEWSIFVKELIKRGAMEKEREDVKAKARERSNEEHRERQRQLAAQERERLQIDDANGAIRGELGSLEEGVGYFPSPATLLFQSSIPDPSPSVADWERREKQRLNLVLRSIGTVVVLYLLFC